MTPIIFNGIIEHGEEKKIVEKVLSENSDIDAIFASGCVMGQCAYTKLQQLNKRIPEDVSLISYDGTFDGWDTGSNITTITQNIEKMAQKCVNIILDLIEGNKVTIKNIVETKFIIGKTTK